jgi:hypothetical protein
MPQSLFPPSWISKLTCWGLILGLWYITFNHAYWKRHNCIICYDAVSYYQYLPAVFQYHDISLDFLDNNPAIEQANYHYHYTEDGKKIIKTSLGMALLYLPFYLIAYLIELARGNVIDSFSPEFVKWLIFSNVVYMSLGLLLLRRILDRYFHPLAAALSLFAVFIGTNLYYYTFNQPAMPHAYSFALIVVYLYLLIQWFENGNWKLSAVIGGVAGLIALVRPTNIFILLFIPLWGLVSWPDVGNRLAIMLSRWRMLLLMMLCFVLIWAPQFMYWYRQTGHIFYFSYKGERFYWNDPEILAGLFSYRKGWLLYTPVMALAFAGIPLLWRYAPKAKWAVPALLAINIYVLLSWWSWWYGGSYGNRAFIDLYGILALPIAAFINWCIDNGRAGAIAISMLIVLLAAHNIFQVYQYRFGAIHYLYMSKDAYWDSFGHLRPSPRFDSLLDYSLPRQPEKNEPVKYR